MHKERIRSSFKQSFLLRKTPIILIILILFLLTNTLALEQTGTNYNSETLVHQGGGNGSSTTYGSLISLPLITGFATSTSYEGGIGAVYALSNYPPTITGSVTLSSTSGNNFTSDNLTLSYTTDDNDGDTVNEVVNWYLNSSSITILNMPFNKRVLNNTYIEKDYSGNEYNGAINNSAWSSEREGSRFFDGDYDDIIVDGAALHGITAVTGSLWFKLNDSGEYNTDGDLIAKGNHGTGSGILLWRDDSVGSGDQIGNLNTISINIVDDDADSKWISLPTDSVNDVAWHHLVFTFSANSINGINLWLDGVKLTTGNTTGVDEIKTDASDISIGWNSGKNLPNNAFKGYIDDVVFFNRVLTDNQITQLYNDGLSYESLSTIVSDETNLMDVWSAVVYPVDEFDEGNSVTSNTLTVGSGTFTIVVNNTFVNYSNAHSFNVTAGVSYTMGTDYISNSTLNYDTYSCVYATNTTSGIYMNVTYTCTGTPYQTTNVNITFCDFTNTCVTTPTTSNSYPNQAPVVSSVVITSSSGNNFTTDNISLTYSTSDVDGDTVAEAIDWRIGGTSIALLNLPFILNSTTINDFTTNSYTITAVNNANYSSERNGSYVFGGGVTSGDYLSFSSTQNISIANTTISFWAKRPINSSDPNNINEFMRILSFTSGYYSFVDLGVDDVTGRFRTSGERAFNGEGFAVIQSSVTADTNWHHFVITSSEEISRLYIDGIYQGLDNDSALTYTTDYLLIRHIGFGFGGNQSTYGSYYNGSLDDIIIFNRSLSQEQITQLYNDGAINKSLQTILSNETSVGDVWTANVTPSDSYILGTSVESNAITIGAGNLSIELNNTFVNYTDAHSFNVTAGVRYTLGASYIETITLNYDTYTCVSSLNSTTGEYLNATFTCTGTPYQTTNVNMTFCTFLNDCVTTPTTSNSYPNQAPSIPTLDLVANNNYSARTRNVFFNWTASTDAEGDSFNYTLNITNAYAPNYLRTNITVANHTTEDELWTEYECVLAENVYFWKVRACDEWDCSDYTGNYNFSIDDYLSVEITNNVIDFGSSLGLGQSNDTTNDAPAPFTFRNDGIIVANLSNVSSTGLWDTVALNTSYFQFKAANSTEANAFNWSASRTSWDNISSTYTNTVIGELDYTDTQDEADIDIGVEVPGTEFPGAKTSSITFTWRAAYE